eukprot:4723052-Lingulodinium_polyedra.AAC.1
MDDAEENTNEVHHCTRQGNLDPVAIPVGDTSDDEGQGQGGPPLPPPGVALDRPGDSKKRRELL